MTTPTPRTDDIQQTIDGLKSWADEERGAGNDSASESLECAAKLMEELQRDLAAREEELAQARTGARVLDGLLYETGKELARVQSVLSADIRNLTEKVIPNIEERAERAEAALAEARKLLHEMVDAWDNGVEDDSIIASRRTTDAFRKAREYLAAIDAREGK